MPLITQKPTQTYSTIKKLMESNVVGYNAPLKSEVNGMTITELLACCHPLDRGDFAKQLYEIRKIDKETALNYGARIH